MYILQIVMSFQSCNCKGLTSDNPAGKKSHHNVYKNNEFVLLCLFGPHNGDI